MNDFHIKNITVTGDGMKPSTLEFAAGLNIVCGPSNTGKSYIVECIDYLFGSSKIRFDTTTGYNSVKASVVTKKGNISFERAIDSNKVIVISTDENIESGEYSIKGKKNINNVWLRLIGIEKEPKIIKNARFEKQRLTWRTFLHMFLIKELEVSQENSIILPKQNTAATATLSALFFLIKGIDFSDTDTLEEKKIKVARKKAVMDYINKRLVNFSKRKEELKVITIADVPDVQKKVEAVIDEIAETEKRLALAVKQNKHLLNELFTLNEQLSECETLYNRYQALKSQYASDIKRLTFIVEGEHQREGIPVNSKCPFCDNSISIQENHNFIEASNAELHRINLQLCDLKEAEYDIINERTMLEKQVNRLKNQRSEVITLLGDELKPKVAGLKKTLNNYREAIEFQKEAAIISGLETTMRNELSETLKEDESEIEYKIKSFFDRSILDGIDAYLKKVLEQCNYEGFSSVYLDPKTFDLIINGKEKATFGQGYRAFLNTVHAIALMEYLMDCGKYSSKLLIVDSPILSLKERDDEKTPYTMKAALFQYLLNNQNNTQLIVIENSIPKLNYNKANIIRFTKDKTHGRYGFLNDVY